jgi:Tfp pilus assembly protein PilO
MEANQFARLHNWIRQPAFILAAVAILGLAITVGLLSLRVIPLSVKGSQLEEKLQELQFQAAVLEKQPIPAKPTEADLQALERQVPSDGDYSGLMVSLREVERKTSARVHSITFGEQEAKNDLESMLSKQAGQPKPADNAAASSSAGASNKAKTTTPAKTLTSPERVNLRVEGTFQQLQSFMRGLHDIAHVVTVQEWSLDQAASGNTTGNDFMSDSTANKMSMDIHMNIYKAASVSKPSELKTSDKK